MADTNPARDTDTVDTMFFQVGGGENRDTWLRIVTTDTSRAQGRVAIEALRAVDGYYALVPVAVPGVPGYDHYQIVPPPSTDVLEKTVNRMRSDGRRALLVTLNGPCTPDSLPRYRTPEPVGAGMDRDAVDYSIVDQDTEVN